MGWDGMGRDGKGRDVMGWEWGWGEVHHVEKVGKLKRIALFSYMEFYVCLWSSIFVYGGAICLRIWVDFEQFEQDFEQIQEDSEQIQEHFEQTQELFEQVQELFEQIQELLEEEFLNLLKK